MTVHHLRGGGTSLLLEDGVTPRFLHWGAALDPQVDLSGLSALLGRPVPHSAPDEPLVQSLFPQAAEGWRLRPALSGLRVDGPNDPIRLSHHQTRWTERGCEVDYTAPATGLHVTVHLDLDEHGVLTQGASLTNTGSSLYAVDRLALTLPLPMRAREVLDLTGRWCRERHPQRTTLGLGTWSRESRHGRTGHDGVTLLHVGTPGFGFGHGEVWAVHLGWSGDSDTWVERDPSGFAQLGVAELLSPGEVVLAPGESYATPTAYAVYSAWGMDEASQALHAHLRARSSHPSRPRPVTLNTWEAVYFDHRLDRLTELADAAASVGVERFVLDDGWFGGRRHDRAGLGDWTVSAQVWPDGLTPLIDAVTSRGMEFGLWVEPEMVNLDSDLARAHPDWLLAPPETIPIAWRHQHVLDLAHPEVFAHILDRLDALLRDHDIAYLKWDHNRDLVQAAHGRAPGVHAQTLAAYRLLDELRSRHPRVEIESCASGGARVDLGIIERTDRVWASDTLDPIERQTIQRWTAALLPPELIGAHIGSEQSHTTGRRASLGFRCVTAFFGHLGIEADLTAMSPVDRNRIAVTVAEHKALRPLLHSGLVVRLDEVDEGAMAHGVIAHDRTEAVFAWVQLTTAAAEVPGRLRLPGLDPSRTYAVRELHLGGGATGAQISGPAWRQPGREIEVPGALLVSLGLQLPVLHPEQGIVLHCREV